MAMISKSKIIIPFILASAAFIFSFIPSVASASSKTIYIIERADGSVTFTSRRPSSGSYKVFNPSAGKSSFSRLNTRSNVKPGPRQVSYYNNLIESTAELQGVDPHLVKAVIQVESAFNPNATSKKGAMGLMQLMPETARSLGVKNPYKPEDNVNGGVKYLKLLLDKYDGNIGLTLAAYNAGEYSVEKHGGIPPFQETIQYVRKVVELRQQYKVERG